MGKNTGPHSLLNRIHGNCRAIAEQSQGKYSAKDVKAIMKGLSAKFDGFPTKAVKVRGGTYAGYTIDIPISLEYACEHDLKILAMTIQVFADEHDMWLVEYDEQGKPYRTVGGRRI